MCSRNCILRDALVWSNVTYTTGECIRHHIVIYWTIYNFLLISLHGLGYVSAVMCDKLCWQAVNYITYPEQIRFYRLYSMARISQLVKIIWTTKVAILFELLLILQLGWNYEIQFLYKMYMSYSSQIQNFSQFNDKIKP